MHSERGHQVMQTPCQSALVDFHARWPYHADDAAVEPPSTDSLHIDVRTVARIDWGQQFATIGGKITGLIVSLMLARCLTGGLDRQTS